jgi:hypothetical protein
MMGITLLASSVAVSAGPPVEDAGGPGGGSTAGEAPVLVGSGQERETVAASDTPITGDVTLTEATASFEDLLAARNTEFVAQSRNQQSIALSEITRVQNAIAAAEQAPQATLPNQTAF